MSESKSKKPMHTLTRMDRDDETKRLMATILAEMKVLDGPGGFPTKYCKTRVHPKFRFHDDRIGACNQKGSRGSTIGTFRRNNLVKGVEKKVEAKFDKLYRALSKLYRKYTGNRAKGIRVNCNIKSKKHRDSRNVGTSTILALGPFTGGQIILYPGKNDEWKKTQYNIRNAFLSFNSTEIEHGTAPFKGKRYSFVFFAN